MNGCRGILNGVGLMLIAILLILMAGCVAPEAGAQETVTATWRDAQSIDLCTPAGELYASGFWVGTAAAGCRVFPVPGQLVDSNVAPRAGVVYCVITVTGRVCAPALERYWPRRLWLPIVAR